MNFVIALILRIYNRWLDAIENRINFEQYFLAAVYAVVGPVAIGAAFVGLFLLLFEVFGVAATLFLFIGIFVYVVYGSIKQTASNTEYEEDDIDNDPPTFV